MSPRESVRGVGRDHAGATSITMQIWYELRQSGQTGLTLDELFVKVVDRVPAGYAWRRYLRQRQTQEQHRLGHLEESKRPNSLPTIPDTPANRAAAVRYVVRASLQSMLPYHTAIRRPDGHYVVGPRKPKSVFSDEQHDFDHSVSRKAVADMELMRVLTGPDGVLALVQERRRQHRNLPSVSTQLAAALDKWVEAHRPASVWKESPCDRSEGTASN